LSHDAPQFPSSLFPGFCERVRGPPPIWFRSHLVPKKCKTMFKSFFSWQRLTVLVIGLLIFDMTQLSVPLQSLPLLLIPTSLTEHPNSVSLPPGAPPLGFRDPPCIAFPSVWKLICPINLIFPYKKLSQGRQTGHLPGHMKRASPSFF